MDYNVIFQHMNMMYSDQIRVIGMNIASNIYPYVGYMENPV